LINKKTLLRKGKDKRKLKIIRKAGFMVLILMLMCSFIFLQANAATSPQKTECKVTKIKLNKKTLKRGNKLTIQVNIKTNKKLKGLKICYIAPFYFSDEYSPKIENVKYIKMKAINKSKTKWKGTIKITKKMVNGTWGIKEISAELNNSEKYFIENNRWCLDMGLKIKRQNLSKGNFKIKET